jgi:hypothetical protein
MLWLLQQDTSETDAPTDPQQDTAEQCTDATQQDTADAPQQDTSQTAAPTVGHYV